MNKTTQKAIDCQLFIRSFSSHQIGTLYLFYGADEYHKEKAVDLIIDRALPIDMRDFDFVTFYGDEILAKKDNIQLSDVYDSFSSNPFLAERKVVLIKNWSDIEAVKQQKILDEFERAKTRNILLLMAGEFDSRLKASKKVLQIGTVVSCERPKKPENMLLWLNNEAKSQGKTLDREAAVLFINMVELDYNIAATELEKLILYSYQRNTITKEDVQQCTGDSKTHNIFELVDSVGEKNMKRSFILVENLIDNEEYPILIITMLLRHFVFLWKINYLRSRRINDYTIKNKNLNEVPYYFRDKYLNSAKKYPLKILPQVFSILLETDTEMKSAGLDEKLSIQRMLFRIFAL